MTDVQVSRPLTEPSAVERVACDLCGVDDAVELYRMPDCRFEVDDIEWPLVQCRRCELAYLNPRPTPAAIGRYYPAHFYEKRDADTLRRRYEAQASYLADLRPGALCDIGCARGDWIKLMAERGWDVHGLEPSEHSGDPYGFRIRNGRFPEDADWPDASFDLVSAWAVFEHLHEPMAAFHRAARLLKSGGHLTILVTNIRSLSSRYGYQEDVPRHLYFFSEKTLARYAARTGFVLERVDHDTEMFGGSGRGVLRVRLFEALGWAPRDYFRFMRVGHAQRFAAHPVFACLGLGVSALERVLFREHLVRWLRASGIIIARMRKL
jgi:SAM-dependent methyltransferase